MDRCAVLVDAGYLIGAAATLITGDSGRDHVAVDYPKLVGSLSDRAKEESGLPVLRLYWYDAARNRQPTPQQRQLRMLPDVKLRLGKLAERSGGRLEQKGVDADLHADLTNLARHRAVADVVLVSGDEDLLRAVEEAQQYGVRIHLWGVAAGAAEYNQSPELIAAADRRHLLDREWLTPFFREAVSASSDGELDDLDDLDLSEPDPEPRDAKTEDGSGIPKPETDDADSECAQRKPSPRDLAALPPRLPRPAVNGNGSANGNGNGHANGHTNGHTNGHSAGYGAGYAAGLPKLRQITTSAQAWQDGEDDATSVDGSPLGVGRTYATRWMARVAPDQRTELIDQAERPLVPRELDPELLNYALKFNIDTWDDEDAKRELRRGFWLGVDEFSH